MRTSFVMYRCWLWGLYFWGFPKEIFVYPSLLCTCSSHTHGPNWTHKWTSGLRRLHIASFANSGRKSYRAAPLSISQTCQCPHQSSAPQETHPCHPLSQEKMEGSLKPLTASVFPLPSKVTTDFQAFPGNSQASFSATFSQSHQHWATSGSEMRSSESIWALTLVHSRLRQQTCSLWVGHAWPFLSHCLPGIAGISAGYR